jgi:hypothetical protein
MVTTTAKEWRECMIQAATLLGRPPVEDSTDVGISASLVLGIDDKEWEIIKLRYALLSCHDTLKDELMFGLDSQRLENRLTWLRDMCHGVLGEPSMAGADKIREQFRNRFDGK